MALNKCIIEYNKKHVSSKAFVLNNIPDIVETEPDYYTVSVPYSWKHKHEYDKSTGLYKEVEYNGPYDKYRCIMYLESGVIYDFGFNNMNSVQHKYSKIKDRVICSVIMEVVNEQ